MISSVPFRGAIVSLLMIGPALAQEDPMEEQRCVWACLANSPGADSDEYNACVRQYCEAPSTTVGVVGETLATEPETVPETSVRPQPRAAEKPVSDSVEQPPPADVPRLPDLVLDTPPGWSFGATADGKGMYAGATDKETGTRLDWLCGKGRPSVLALSPYAGGAVVTVTVGGRSQTFDVQVENGTAYMPISLTSPLFLHLASGPEVIFADVAGASLGRFPMAGAPLAIGQAEGRCR